MHSWAPSFGQELQAQGHRQRKGFSREAEFMLLALCYEDGRRSKSNEPLQNTGATVQAGWNAAGPVSASDATGPFSCEKEVGGLTPNSR